MVTRNLWERLKRSWNQDYIEIEEWTTEMDKEAEKQFVQDLVTHLESCHPGIKVVFWFRTYCEMRATGHPLFEGYNIKLVPGVDLKELKRTCMEFERDKTGKRVADLDIYYKCEKVSRNDPLYNFFIS